MKHWSFALILFTVLSLSTVLQAVTAEESTKPKSDVPEVWLDTRPSDAPLRGKDVVRRPESDLRDFSSAEFAKTWTLVVDGTRPAPNVCGYSLEFSEPVDKATPKIFSVTAVDLATCQVEFTVGIPAKVERQGMTGMEVESLESGLGTDVDSIASNRPGYMLPNAFLLQDVGDEAKSQVRSTVIGEWKDPVNFVVNQVLSAVKAKVDRKGRLSDHRCRHDWAWWKATGWQDRSTGKWGDAEGTTCANYLRWVDFKLYPGQYNSLGDL